VNEKTLWVGKGEGSGEKFQVERVPGNRTRRGGGPRWRKGDTEKRRKITRPHLISLPPAQKGRSLKNKNGELKREDLKDEPNGKERTRTSFSSERKSKNRGLPGCWYLKTGPGQMGEIRKKLPKRAPSSFN